MGLDIENLIASIKNKVILDRVSMKLQNNKINLLMGPNGSGKSTLLKIISGDPDYKISAGKVIYENHILNGLNVQEIANLGIFLAFQYPIALPGVSVLSFLKSIAQSYFKNILKRNFSIKLFYKNLEENLNFLGINETYLNKEVNVEFSGGEKKKLEVLQMLTLNPKMILLDEIDSGLDADSIKIIAGAINKLISNGSTVLIVTHYKHILDYIKPTYVYIMYRGRVVHHTDNLDVVDKINTLGYN
jgi:Fe-S cluster assembly ATP-binding protein